MPSVKRLAVDGHAERRADLVLAAIAPADGPLLIVEDGEAAASGHGRFPWATSGMPSFLTSGNTAALIGASRGCNSQHDALLRLAVFVGHLVLVVGLAQEGQRGPVGPGRRLDHVRDVPLACVMSSK